MLASMAAWASVAGTAGLVAVFSTMMYGPSLGNSPVPATSSSSSVATQIPRFGIGGASRPRALNQLWYCSHTWEEKATRISCMEFSLTDIALFLDTNVNHLLKHARRAGVELKRLDDPRVRYALLSRDEAKLVMASFYQARGARKLGSGPQKRTKRH